MGPAHINGKKGGKLEPEKRTEGKKETMKEKWSRFLHIHREKRGKQKKAKLGKGEKPELCLSERDRDWEKKKPRKQRGRDRGNRLETSGFGREDGSERETEIQPIWHRERGRNKPIKQRREEKRNAATWSANRAKERERESSVWETAWVLICPVQRLREKTERREEEEREKREIVRQPTAVSQDTLDPATLLRSVRSDIFLFI